MTQFQLVSTTYRNVSGKPVITIYGRDSFGNSIVKDISWFKPYMYVRPKDYAYNEVVTRLKGFEEVEEILDDFKFLPMGYQTDRSPVLKVYTKRPGDVPKIRDALLTRSDIDGIYDADILFASSRFLADENLFGMGWHQETEDGHFVHLPEVPGNAPLRYFSWDIEVLVPEKGAPISTRDQIILISVAMNLYGGHQKTIVLVAKPGTNFGSDNYSIHYYSNEKDLLIAFLNTIHLYDPDVLMGYNINSFDFPYLEDRLRLNGISDAMGRDGSSAQIRSFGSKHEVRITGRIVADLLDLVKQNYSLANYKLGTVASTLLKEDKLDVKASEMRRLWLSEDPKDLSRFIEYSRRDSDLVLSMAVDLKILDKYIAIAKECGCLLHDVLNSGQQVRIESLLLHEFVKEGRMFPIRKKDVKDESIDQEDSEDPEDITVHGAYVFEPEKGLHENLIIMDFKSLYPSCMRAYNLCVSTIINEDPVPPSWKVLTPPNNVHYIDHSIYEGIIPRILTRLYNKRVEFKRLMKEAENSSDKDFYDAAQYATKILLNSIYGFTGAQSSRFFDPRIANSVTSIGRETIKLTQKTAESMLPCKVIGGDTDSIFLKLFKEDTPEGGLRASNIIHSAMLGLLPPPMEIDFEAFAKRALLFQKKRYCMWIFEPSKEGFKDKMKVRGIELRRRDWCPLVGETMGIVLDLILKEGKVEEARQYSMNVIRSVQMLQNVNTNWELAEKLILSKQISKGFDQYSVKMPHVEVCRQMEARGETPYGLGDRVPYFVLPGASGNSISGYVDTPEYIREHGARIDVTWYIEKQLMPPLRRIFNAINIDITTGKKFKVESNLFDFKECSNIIPRPVTKKSRPSGGLFSFEK